jgi:hypothetical protein
VAVVLEADVVDLAYGRSGVLGTPSRCRHVGESRQLGMTDRGIGTLPDVTAESADLVAEELRRREMMIR